MYEFLNTFVKDWQTFWIVAVAAMLLLVVFSILYNRWMDDLGEKKEGYTALLVAIGNGATLLAVATLSWKAAVLMLLAFVASGTAMIVGDIQRATLQREKTARSAARRKPLPYAAAGLIDDALMGLTEGQRAVRGMLNNKVDVQKIGLVGMQIAEAIHKLTEARRVEGE